MQLPFLSITVGFQFFLIVGFLFYTIFRKYPTGDDRISLMSWTTGLIGVLIFGLVGSLLLLMSSMPTSEFGIALALSFADILGLYLLVDDTLKARRTSQALDD
ncbi:MAG: hypothetical protein RTU63_10910 [Candidatus Thorarchaeota archaeon]